MTLKDVFRKVADNLHAHFETARKNERRRISHYERVAWRNRHDLSKWSPYLTTLPPEGEDY